MELLAADLASLDQGLAALALAGARGLPIAWQVPALGGRHVPRPLRLALGLGLSALCLPLVLAALPPRLGGVGLVLLLAREAAVGLTVGFVASTLFRAAEAAGRLVDTLRGANLAEALAPGADSRPSPLGDLGLLLAVVIFLQLGGVGHLARALVRSYEAAPLALTASPATLGAAAKLVVLASARLLEGAVGLAAPAVVALLLADLALGAVARFAPQIPVYFVGLPVKALGGVAVVLLGLGSLDVALTAGFHGWAALVAAAFSAWH